MTSGNINLRDPTLYRIVDASHPRTGTKWKIYPSYDFAHGQSDAIEGVTHSICTLEFEDHRPLYDWFLANLPVPAHPHQYEFARLNLTYTLLSKRILNTLVRDELAEAIAEIAMRQRALDERADTTSMRRDQRMIADSIATLRSDVAERVQANAEFRPLEGEGLHHCQHAAACRGRMNESAQAGTHAGGDEHDGAAVLQHEMIGHGLGHLP